MLLNKRFTIGEMAKMHNIAESTLRYYDEKGIFHPSIVDPQTNYRYYTIDQFSLLDTIKFLRQLNIPLKEIKKYIDERNPAYALNLLEKQQEMMLKKQRDIEYALAKMEHRIHLIKKATKAETDRIVIKKIPKRKITAIAVAPNTTDDMFDYYIHSLQKNMKQMDDSLFSGDIGVTISKKHSCKMNFKHIAVCLFFWIICRMKCILQMKLKKVYLLVLITMDHMKKQMQRIGSYFHTLIKKVTK